MIGGDESALSDLLRVLRSSVTVSSAVLARAFAVGDLRAIAKAAHKLKSYASSIGALQMGLRCSELEAAAEAGQQDAIAALVALFEADLQTVIHYLGNR